MADQQTLEYYFLDCVGWSIYYNYNLDADQKGLVRCLIKYGLNWVAADKDGSVFAYENKPFLINGEEWHDEEGGDNFQIRKTMINPITWDMGAIPLQDLLEEE